MTFEINKTEYIAVIAGMDCLPRTNEDEIIDPSYIELAQKAATDHFANRFPSYSRIIKKSTNYSLEIIIFKSNFRNGNLTLSNSGIYICLSSIMQQMPLEVSPYLRN